MLWKILVIPILALALAAAACGDDDGGGDNAPDGTTPPAGTATDAPTDAPSDSVIAVQAIDFAFDQGSISATAGTVVEVDFANGGVASHTFTVDELGVDLLLAGGDNGTVQFTFPDESFEFYCRIHPTQMRGTLEPGG